MGNCCTKDDGSNGTRRGETIVAKRNTFHTTEDGTDIYMQQQQETSPYTSKQNHRHQMKQEESVTGSMPPSPQRSAPGTDLRAQHQQQNNNNNSNNNKFQQSPHKQRMMALEPTNTSPEDNLSQQSFNNKQQQHNSPPTTKFLTLVNGAGSHAVARVIFEQWCVILNAIEKQDEALLLGVGGNENHHHLDAGLNDHDLLDDGFGGGGVGTNTVDSSVGGDSTAGKLKNFNREIFFNQKMFGENVQVSHSSNLTRVEKWATLHASEAVTHESVEEVVQAFLPFLREDVKNRGWGGEFDYDQQGYDMSGVVSLNIKLVRFDGEEMPHNYNIVVNYHAVSLL